MPLSDVTIRGAKPKAKPYKLTDSEGLYLLVSPAGARLWRMNYRFNGRQKTLAFGAYPAVGLADARFERLMARKLLAAGTDPGLKKRLDKLVGAVTAANTFRVIGEDWIARITEEGAAERTVKKHAWLLRLADPILGDRPISEIKSPEVYALLKRVEKSGRKETARRLRATCSRVFRHAIMTARADFDPCVTLIGSTVAPTVTHRAAIVDPREVSGLIRSIRGYVGNFSTQKALELLSLTFVRSSELRYATWDEFDLDKALWSIPAERMKMGRPHLVPLSRQALAVLRDLRAASTSGKFLFPSVRSADRPISENTVNAALRRMGYDKTDMTGHGFRTTASTRLNEMGFASDWIERQLAHVEGNKVRAAYNAAEWLPERAKMMQRWADWLNEVELLG